MEELIVKNLPSWALGLLAVLFAIREIIFLIKERHPMFNALKKYQNVFAILDDIQAETGADRVMLLKAHDSGKELTPKTKLYSSVVFSTASKGLINIAEEWDNQPVDNQYLNLLIDLSQKKMICLKTKEMNEGLLKTLYKGKGIQTTFVAEVLQVKQKKSLFKSLLKKEMVFEYLYVSANFKKDLPNMPKIQDQIRAGASRIRREIR